MSGKDGVPSPNEMRRFLDDALKEFQTAANPDNRLRSLWKISQLVENTTDEELYELASVAAVEQDHRLRGEICYAISRSQRPQLRPQLIQILKGMILDKDPYVRSSAITALDELGGPREATLASIDTTLDDVDRLKSIVMSLEERLLHLRKSIEELADVADASSPAYGIVMDNYMRCWETYIRHEAELLRDHRGKYVAIYGEEIVGIDEDAEKLAGIIYEKYGYVEALVCKIEEEGEPIWIPPPRQVLE